MCVGHYISVVSCVGDKPVAPISSPGLSEGGEVVGMLYFSCISPGRQRRKSDDFLIQVLVGSSHLFA